MFISNEAMQVLKADKATFSGTHKVGQVRTFMCGDGSKTRAKCTHVFSLNSTLQVAEFSPIN